MRHRVKKHLHLNGKDKAHRTNKRALAITPTIEKLIEVAKGPTTDYNKIRYIAPEVHTEESSRAVMAVAPKYVDRKG